MIIEFIENKLNDHVEPERTRLYRGERMGFSSPKLLACLWTALTALPLNVVAKKADVSEGLLRQWRMQDDFKSQEEEIRDEFMFLFIEKFQIPATDIAVEIFKGLNNLLQKKIILALGHRKPRGAKEFLSFEALKKAALETSEKQRRDRIDEEFRLQINGRLPLTKKGLQEVVEILKDPKSSTSQKEVAIDILSRSSK